MRGRYIDCGRHAYNLSRLSATAPASAPVGRCTTNPATSNAFPMPVPLLDLRAQHATIRDDVVREMMQVVEAQTFILGEPVERLEAAVAELSHTRFAVGCASGTDALLLPLRALDVGRGDDVITMPFTFFATA